MIQYKYIITTQQLMIQYGDQSGMMIMSLGFFPGNISVYAKKCNNNSLVFKYGKCRIQGMLLPTKKTLNFIAQVQGLGGRDSH